MRSPASIGLLEGLVLALLLAVALPARAETALPSPLAFEAGLGLRYVVAEHALSLEYPGSAFSITPSISTLAIEGQAGVAYRTSSAGRYGALLRYARSADQGESSAFSSGSFATSGGGDAYYESNSASQGTLQQAELRLEAAYQLPGAVELGPWASLRYGRLDVTLGDTSQTTWVLGTPSSSYTAGPTFTYRDTSQAAWIGLAARWNVVSGLRLGAEVALSPWARDRYTLDNLVMSSRSTGEPTGTGWRARAEVDWSPGHGHSIVLASSVERLDGSGAVTGSVYAGTNQGFTADGQGQLKQEAWDVALGWVYAF
jgi:hypothetical protein